MEIVEALPTCLAGRANLGFAVLFGSCAKGSVGPASDVDLAIVPRSRFSLADEGDRARSVEEATGRARPLRGARAQPSPPRLFTVIPAQAGTQAYTR